MLAVALRLHEAGLHSCGHPREMAFSGDAEGIFEVIEETCQACAALERHRRDHEGKQRQPGQTAAVVNTLPDGEVVRPWRPSLRSDPGHAADDQGYQATEREQQAQQP